MSSGGRAWSRRGDCGWGIEGGDDFLRGDTSVWSMLPRAFGLQQQKQQQQQPATRATSGRSRRAAMHKTGGGGGVVVVVVVLVVVKAAVVCVCMDAGSASRPSRAGLSRGTTPGLRRTRNQGKKKGRRQRAVESGGGSGYEKGSERDGEREREGEEEAAKGREAERGRRKRKRARKRKRERSVGAECGRSDWDYQNREASHTTEPSSRSRQGQYKLWQHASKGRSAKKQTAGEGAWMWMWMWMVDVDVWVRVMDVVCGAQDNENASTGGGGGVNLYKNTINGAARPSIWLYHGRRTCSPAPQLALDPVRLVCLRQRGTPGPSDERERERERARERERESASSP